MKRGDIAFGNDQGHAFENRDDLCPLDHLLSGRRHPSDFDVCRLSIEIGVADRAKARDTNAVLDDLIALAESWESRAWIFSAAFTIDRLKAGNLITPRAGGLGFNMRLPAVFSGEGGILDSVVEFDTSLSVALGG